MGDFTAPQTVGSKYVADPGGLPAFSPYTVQPGGQFKNDKYGIAGMVAANGGAMSFMTNISKQDTDLCPTQMGVGLGLRQDPAKSLQIEDVKGTYYLAAVGDRQTNKASRPLYLTTAGTLTFDGAGGVKLALTENAEGELTSDVRDLTYRVTRRGFPVSADTAVLQTDVVELLDGANPAAPFATAVLNEDNHTMIFFRNLNLNINKDNNFVGTANDTRLMGLGVLQKP
jgi:hypothetical protein